MNYNSSITQKTIELAALMFDIDFYEYNNINELYHLILSKQKEYCNEIADILKDCAINIEGWTESTDCTYSTVWKEE